MSLEPETFIYIFSTPNMEKSHAFLEVRLLGFFNCIDDTHNRFQFHTQFQKNISNFQALSKMFLEVWGLPDKDHKRGEEVCLAKFFFRMVFKVGGWAFQSEASPYGLVVTKRQKIGARLPPTHASSKTFKMSKWKSMKCNNMKKIKIQRKNILEWKINI